MPKRLRQHHILELVGEESLSSQDQLRRRLAQRGLRVTQATLSRDLKELGLVKTSHGYTRPSPAESSAPPPPSLPHLLQEFLLDVREAQTLLVLKTNPGSAQPVAGALDSQQWRQVVGTIAGDDTVLVVTHSRQACRDVAQRIRELIA